MITEDLENSFIEIEKLYEVKYSSKYNKDYIIGCLANTEVPLKVAFGYKTTGAVSKLFNRIIKNHNKPINIHWRNWVLSHIDKFMCYDCLHTHHLSNKITDSRSNFRCKTCDSTNSKNKRISNREKLYTYLLKHACTDCGLKNPIVLEFDHTNPSNKLYNISDMMSKPWLEIEKEINKCEVVCANCHRIRTAKQHNWYSFLSD